MASSNGSWTSVPIATMRRSFGMASPSNSTRRPRPDHRSNVEKLCEEKCWSMLATRIVLIIMPPPHPPVTNAPRQHDHGEVEQCERGLVADLLSQLDAAGVPSEVMVAIVSLSRKRQTQQNAFQHWPTNSSPATRHSLQMPCRSAACPAHLSVIFQYLAKDTRRQARQEIIRLLTAVLYLTSDEDIVELFLCMVFDLTVQMLHSDEEEEGDEMKVERAAAEIADDTETSSRKMRRQKSMVLQRSEFIASKIGECGNWVSTSLHGKVVPTVNNGIDQAGNLVKKTIPPAPEPIIDRRTAAVTLTCTDAVRRSTHGIRSGTQVVSTRVRSGATSVAKIVGDCIAEEANSPDKEETKEQTEKRELLAAAGALSMATVGAVALVGESIIESGKAVVYQTSNVTADIVRHRHGDDAGQIVSDVFESTGNVLSITRTSFQATHISKAATKNIAKMHIGGG
mmetsp:Transcript_23847/g.68493  ORF Transcript_23847/g.68493 Transcript_23847/m.68493 type:complete len:454 (+) Transcript_23847:156-1517(+)